MINEETLAELEGISIVVIGNFNPAIFHPQWFARFNLIRAEEADSATVDVVTGAAALFHTEWFSLQVLGDRLTLSSADPSKYQPLRDLLVGTLKTLEHTPIQAFGLNAEAHFGITDIEEWHRVGHRLAPKEVWNQFLEAPGMQSLAILGKRAGSKATTVQMKVEPSSKLKPGVYVSINQHYELSQIVGDTPGTGPMLGVLTEEWDAFMVFREKAPSALVQELRQAD